MDPKKACSRGLNVIPKKSPMSIFTGAPINELKFIWQQTLRALKPQQGPKDSQILPNEGLRIPEIHDMNGSVKYSAAIKQTPSGRSLVIRTPTKRTTNLEKQPNQ